MLVYDTSLENDLTDALKVSYHLQETGGIQRHQILERQLEYLSLYANYDHIDNTICVLCPDFADYSFSFGMYFRGRLINPRVSLEDVRKNIESRPAYMSIHEALERYSYSIRMNGGLIFHGNHDNGGDGSFPTFSVNLTAVNGWSVHT